MDVEITTPNDHVGDVVGDSIAAVASSRVRRQRLNCDDPSQVPLKEMFAVYLASALSHEGPRFLHHAVPPL